MRRRAVSPNPGLLHNLCGMRQSHSLSHIVRGELSYARIVLEKRGFQDVFSACYPIENGKFLKKQKSYLFFLVVHVNYVKDSLFGTT
jgi:hypothetical protein